MKVFYRYILTFLLVALFLCGCGPKPKVTVDEIPYEELIEKPLNQTAFQFYLNGVIAELEENYDLALSNYSSALAYAPDSYDIRIALAKIFMGMRNFERAREILQPLDNRFSEAVLMKADCRRGMGDWQDALNYYEIAQKIDPNEIASFWYMGQYYVQTEEYGKAIEQYERMMLMSDNVQIHNELARLYMTVADTVSALKTYEKSLEVDPTASNRDGYITHSQILRTFGNLDSAMVLVKQYIDLVPSSVEARLELIELYILSQRRDDALQEINSVAEEFPNRTAVIGQLGLYSLDLNEIESAQKYFEELAELDKQNYLAVFYLGRIAQFNADLELAKEYFYSVVDLADTIPDGWLNLAEVYRMQDSLDMAVSLIRQGLDHVQYGKQDMSIFLSRYYAQQERFQAVINVLEGIVDSSTTDVAVLFSMGSAYERIGEFDKSVTMFEQLLSISPDFHPALNYLGYMLADNGIRLKESRDMIERAMAQDSVNPAYQDSYGWVLFKMGEYAEAIKYIKMALEQMENDVVIYDHLAEIYYAQGRREEARKLWEKALGIEPDNIAIREKLDR